MSDDAYWKGRNSDDFKPDYQNHHDRSSFDIGRNDRNREKDSQKKTETTTYYNPDAGKDFGEGIASLFGFAIEFIKAPLFEKALWAAFFGICFNALAVAMTSHEDGHPAIERFGYLIAAGLFLVYILRKNRSKVVIFSLIAAALFFWDYKIIANDIAKTKARETQR